MDTRVRRLFVHWNYVRLSWNEGTSVDDSVKGSWGVGREEVGNIERVEWIVVTNRERYVEEPIIFFLSRARNAME